jgi:hypothetical protein
LTDSWESSSQKTRAAIIGALQTRIKATSKIIATQFAIFSTITGDFVTRFRVLEDGFNVSISVVPEYLTRPTGQSLSEQAARDHVYMFGVWMRSKRTPVDIEPVMAGFRLGPASSRPSISFRGVGLLR